MANICLLQTTDHNDKSGIGRKTIEWFDELDRIMGRRPASQSHLLLQSGTEMQLKAAFEDESDDKTEGTIVAYNYTAHLMKCRKLPHRPDTNNIIIGISLPISVSTYRDTRTSPLCTCKCRSMGYALACRSNTSSCFGRSLENSPQPSLSCMICCP